MGMEQLTIKTIMESGRIHYIKTQSKKLGISPEEMITNSTYRELHETIYGELQNKMTYLNTYGKFLN